MSDISANLKENTNSQPTANSSGFGWADLIWYTAAVIRRPLRKLFRYLFLPEEMGVILERFSARGEAMKPQNGAREFAEQLRYTFPRIQEFTEEVKIFFERHAGPNYIAFMIGDSGAEHIQMFEVCVRRINGLTPNEICARLRRGMNALAAADVRMIEKAGLPTAIFVQMIYATCYQSPPPITEEIPMNKLMAAAHHKPEVIDFLMFYNCWLKSGMTL